MYKHINNVLRTTIYFKISFLVKKNTTNWLNLFIIYISCAHKFLRHYLCAEAHREDNWSSKVYRVEIKFGTSVLKPTLFVNEYLIKCIYAYLRRSNRVFTYEKMFQFSDGYSLFRSPLFKVVLRYMWYSNIKILILRDV